MDVRATWHLVRLRRFPNLRASRRTSERPQPSRRFASVAASSVAVRSVGASNCCGRTRHKGTEPPTAKQTAAAGRPNRRSLNGLESGIQDSTEPLLSLLTRVQRTASRVTRTDVRQPTPRDSERLTTDHPHPTHRRPKGVRGVHSVLRLACIYGGGGLPCTCWFWGLRYGVCSAHRGIYRVGFRPRLWCRVGGSSVVLVPLFVSIVLPLWWQCGMRGCHRLKGEEGWVLWLLGLLPGLCG